MQVVIGQEGDAVDLQPLFADPILEQTALDPGYTDHANDVWRVRTAAGTVVVRVTRVGPEPPNPFWWGLGALFGINAHQVGALPAVHALVGAASPVPVPRVLRCAPDGAPLGRPYTVMEHMPGRPPDSLRHPGLAEQLGEALGHIHGARQDGCGRPDGAWRYPLAEFHPRLARTSAALAGRWHPGRPELAAAAAALAARTEALPPPDWGAPVLGDLDQTQFLWDGQRLTALVDLEAYVIGPRALDLVALEQLLDAPAAAAFARGYRRVLPFPDLAPVRAAYRLFLLLYGAQGHPPLAQCMAGPAHFDGCRCPWPGDCADGRPLRNGHTRPRG